jgi:OOP family OmpA-OmpF porin
MDRKIFIVGAAALLAGLCSLPAGATSGLYLGGGVGAAAVKEDVSGETLDAGNAGYKAFIGYRFDQVPIVDLALEGGYTDFGGPSKTIAGQEAKFKLHGAYAAGLLILPLGPIDLYGKGGAYNWRSELSFGGATDSRSGSDPFYGVGVGFYVWKIGIRAEYERYQIKDVDRVEMFSVNALFQF